MEAKRYAVIDLATHIVINVVMWDGGDTWSPPKGTEVVESDTLGIDDKFSEK